MQRDKFEKKQMGINLLANVVSYSANLIISFVLTPFLINTIGKETYSFYPMANTLVSYMSVITTSMNTVASRFVTISLVKGEKEEANKYFSSVLVSNAVISTIVLIPALVIVVFLDRILNVPINSVAAIKCLFALVFSSAIINIMASVFGIATFAKNRIDLRSLRELITAGLRLVLFLLLYAFLPPSIIYVGVVTLIVSIVNILFQRFYTHYLLPEIKISWVYCSKRHTLELASSSAWNAINSLGNTLLAGMTMILANKMFGEAVGGSFSIVQTVPQFLNGVIIMLVGVFYPAITYRYAEGDKQGLVHEIRNAQAIIGIVGCSIIAVFTALSEEFFMLWTPNENATQLAVLSTITIIPHIFISWFWPLTNLNVVMNMVEIPAIFTLVSGLANVLLSIVAVQVFNGSLLWIPAISTVLQVLWVGVFIPLYACSNLAIEWHTFYNSFYKALIASIGLFLLINKTKQFIRIDGWVPLFFWGGIWGIIALIVMGLIVLGPYKSVDCLKKIISKIK